MRRAWIALALGVCGCAHPPAAPKHRPPLVATPNPGAVWPWPRVEPEELGRGVTRWFTEGADGSTLELFRFDFAGNPRLRFELYDQDEDDAVPFDNRADYYPRGIGAITKHLIEKKTGRILAAWNGPFFGYDRRQNPPHGLAHHVGPVFLDGHMRFNVGRPRWCFGVKNGKFVVLHSEDLKPGDTRLDFGAAGLQCLMKDGMAMKLQPARSPDDPPLRQPVPCGPNEAGCIPNADFMRTSRMSLAWTKDSGQLYLLAVNEPDTELASKLAVRRFEAFGAGFTLDDVQRFWLSFNRTIPIWGAVNSDGGSVAQLAYLRGTDEKYEVMPARIAAANWRLSFAPDFEGAPGGGTLMTFYVREKPP